MAQTADDQPAATAPAPTAPTPTADDDDKAKAASRSLRRAYSRWRQRLHRYGAYTGRDLLLDAHAADGSRRDPTARQLRRSIHRMQKRLHRYLRTPKGRAAAFGLKVRTIPSWARGQLRGIAWCESKNDPRAVGGGGAYRGMYQFSVSTWSVVGGSGDPAAASRAEQTWRAWLLLSRHGAGHWPICG